MGRGGGPTGPRELIMKPLEQLRIAVLATDGFEESELTEPVRALQEAGARVEIIAPQAGPIQAFRKDEKSVQVRVDRSLEEAKASDYDALMLPGGARCADQLRTDMRVQCFVREIDQQGKPIAAICHAPWTLVSAGVIKGHRVTSYPSIQDDLKNAGANWLDQEVVVDGHWVTSRGPQDLPAFNREMIDLFARVTPPIINIAESA